MPEDSTLHNDRCENLKSYIRNFTVSFTKFMYDDIVKKP
jgi:hypothetical protein